MNSSEPSTFLLPWKPLGNPPLYNLTARAPLFPWISDFHLSLLLPVSAYWVLSATYHIISAFDFFSQYRLHSPAEFKIRNRPTVAEVLRSVILQQIIQTGWGLVLGHTVLGTQEMVGTEDYDIAMWAIWTQRLACGLRLILEGVGMIMGVNVNEWKYGFHSSFITYQLVITFFSLAFSSDESQDKHLAEWEMLAGRAMYFVVIPAFRFAIAIFLSDTWQYFWHRAMHSNRWLFRNMHAPHHRIYVPYAFGAFYNTLWEAFVLDTLGTTLSLYVAGLSTRQATLFGTLSVLKGVDDHCGYKLPWDPLQWLGEQTVEFHDVTNYSQLYLTFWDHVCGTVCRKSEAEKQLLYQRGQIEADKKDRGGM
ncbi:putative fatty acid hydroxylase [Hyphodiscus hymeniophilus]|uniref:Fatty acid hydroxylase n=1 Tax=Hyphodiscus hymeniophilus TaxID=353542 RepID=A0A9P6VHB4_9HELO|nr:putative fatty acid hydroxylase [Hyphodiscus hymeniophilus]